MPTLYSTLSLLALVATSSASPLSRRQECGTDIGFDVDKVVGKAKEKASHSWEYGATAEALLELYNPELSVFGKDAFPNGQIPTAGEEVQALAYVKQFIGTDGDAFIDGDGAIGDPAAVGISALLLGQAYFDVADRQTQTILNAPKFDNGAISQRADVAELWADFMYMAPPYLAYYAVHKGDEDLLRETVKQCGLYRDVLGGGGLWKHIEGPQSQDSGKWSTGNGWAAMGMARVLATVKKWEKSSGWTDEIGQLEGWVKEILDAAKDAPTDNDLLRNYIDDDSWFGETSGSALLAATAYRMVSLGSPGFDDHVQWAEGIRGKLPNHIGDDGVMGPAVNPLNWNDRNQFWEGSPEGQAFGAMLGAAYRDWKCAQ